MQTDGKQIASTRPITDHKIKGRSRLSNHVLRQLLPDLDGRRKTARRFRDIANAIAQDMGGADRLTEVQKQLVRRFAAGAVVAEGREARMAAGEAFDAVRWSTLCNVLLQAQAFALRKVNEHH